MSLLYPGVSGQKFKPFSTTDFSNGESCFQQKNKRNQNEKTIMVTTWHPALKHLPKILQEKYHQHIEKDIYLQKVFPQKPVIAFRKMKSIRNYIVRTDINEGNDQKKPSITTPCYSCRKTCHLISSDEIL